MRRRLQWTVRGLLLLTTICAVVTLLVLTPRVREREAIEWLEEKGARFKTEPVGPGWLRKLLGDRYLQCVTSADLGRCQVSDADLARLSPLRHLRNLELSGTTVTIDGVERMASQWRNIHVDVLLADILYRAAEAESLVHRHPFYEAIVECQMAARWKTAWADSRGSLGDRVAARRQFIDGLQRCAAALQEGDKSMTPLEQTMFEAAMAEGRIELAKLSQSDSAIVAARREGELAGTALVRRLDGAIAASVGPFEFDASRELATRLLLESRSKDEDAAYAVNVFADAAKQTEVLARRIESDYHAGRQGGEAEKMVLCTVNVELAHARLAEARGDRARELKALHWATHDAYELRKAAESAFDAGTMTIFEFSIAHRRATELERMLWHARGDREAELEIDGDSDMSLSLQLALAFWGDNTLGPVIDESHKYLVGCQHSLAKYEKIGASLYDQPVSALGVP